jgi:6-phosphofructo-2-kinase/fructose-2,6-biphosphatase 4
MATSKNVVMQSQWDYDRLYRLYFVSSPELCSDLDHTSTADIAANAPRYRRRSSTFIDGVHDLIEDKKTRAPAQLYSTMSGRLFHSGRIAIVLVGPPARGKT